MGERLRDWGVAVQWNTELVGLEQAPDHVTATLKRRRRHDAEDHGRVGRRLRRRAQRGARAERHRFPGAPYEHVFFVADTEVDRQHGAGRGQRLPLAQGIPSVLPDARQGPLAHRRHPARGPATAKTTSLSRTWFPRCAAKRARDCRSRRAAGSPPTASTIAARRASATAAASCSATRRTSTARSARRA